jgi:hypothetical protein
VKKDDIGYDCIALLVAFLSFVAPGVSTLKITSTLEPFPGGAPFWKALPNLHRVVLTAISTFPEEPSQGELPAFFDQTHHGPATSLLESICLQGTSSSYHISRLTYLPMTITLGSILFAEQFPSFPRLTSLSLSDVDVSHLHCLLTQAPNLVVLRLHNVSAGPPRWGRAGGPPIFNFPRLRSIEIAGACPSLWTPPANGFGDFVIEAPMLQAVDFGRQQRNDVEMRCTAHYSWRSTVYAYDDLERAQLSRLFNTSPNLQMLRLDRPTSLQLPELIRCFSNAPIALTYLSISNDLMMELVDCLDSLVPNLSHLIISDGNDPLKDLRDYWFPSLARLAHRLSQRPSFQSLDITTHSPNSISSSEPFPSLDTLRTKLISLLPSISLLQLSFLVIEVVLDPYPGSPSFQSFHSDVLHLASPALSGHRNAGIDATPHRRGGNRSQQLAVRRALKCWQEMREFEGAVEWFGAQNDKIALRFVGKDTKTMRELMRERWESASTMDRGERRA